MPAMSLIAAGFLLSVLACAPGQDPRVFPVSAEQKLSVPGKNLVSDPLGELGFAGLDEALSQSVSRTLQNQGVDANDVDDFHVERLLIEVTAPLDRDGQPVQDLRFLDSLRFTLTAPGLDEALLGQSADGAFAQGVFRYDFTVDRQQNLKNYLAAASMSLNAEAQANDRPALGCDLHILARFEIAVNPVGLLD